MAKIIVGMSGGVDSAVAAYLLKKAGHDVAGVTLRTWQSADGGEGRCCEIDDARESAGIIGVPYLVINCTAEFENKVIKPFADDYLGGFTPNPCVICNREVKWERLLFYANALGADYVATGHYARVLKLENGRYTVRKAAHAEKDQTYMLYRLSQEALSRTVMPLWELSKSEVRETAEKIGLKVAAKPDSQEICFVPEGRYADFITEYTGVTPAEGDFVDETGKVLGRHKGIINYTVGQRKGLGIALGRPAYVKKICADTNEIVLSASDETGCVAIYCKSLNFLSIEEPRIGERFEAFVKVRYRHPGIRATVEKVSEDCVKIVFSEAVRAAAPGQSAVFYDENDCVIGGGIISEVEFM